MKDRTKKRIRQGFSNLVSLIQKNLKLLIRARASALIVILGPLLIIFLAGLAFDNTNMYSVRIGAYSHSYNDLSNSFLDKLAENQFDITRYPAQDSCISSIRNGETHTCLVFPQDFAIGKEGSNIIEFYVDYSKLNLVWTITNVMSKSISRRSLELSRNLTGVILNALEFAKTQSSERKANIIQLTTVNNEISRRISGIRAELGEIELQINPEHFGLSNLSSAKSTVKHWVDNSLSIARSSLRDSRSFVDSAYEFVQSNEDAAAALQQTIDELAELTDRLDTTEELVNSEYSELSELIDHITGKITQTKSQLDVADNARQFTLDEVETINQLLDKSLVNILAVQKTLDEIQAVFAAIEVTDPEAIVQPIQTSIKPVVAERSYLNYLFPSLLCLVIMFTALLLAPILIMLERNSAAHFRNFMTPTRDNIFISAIFLTVGFVLLVQVTVVLVIASIFFTQLLSAVLQVALAVLLLIAVFTLLGMLVGYLFNTEETAILGAISLGSLMLFLSDIIIPVESMPSLLRTLARFNPLVVGTEILRRTSLFGAGIAETASTFVLLVVYAVLLAVLVLAVYYFLRKHKFRKYLSGFGRQNLLKK